MVIFLLIITFCTIIFLFIEKNNKESNSVIPSQKENKLDLNYLKGIYGGNLGDYLFTECYPYVIFPHQIISTPLIARVLYSSINNDSAKLLKRGRSEELLFNRLKQSQFAEYIFWGQHALGEFYPDILFINSNDSIFIDIEIDEPYSLDTKKEIHFIDYNATKYFDKNSFRDNFFVNNGWTVIRFSEQQVMQDLEQCIIIIENSIAFLSSTAEELSLKPIKIKRIPRWTLNNSIKLALSDSRINYLTNQKEKSLFNNIPLFQKLIEKKDENWYELNLYGPVRQVTTNIFNSETKLPIKTIVSEFDINGLLRHRYIYNSNGKTTSINEYFYKEFIRNDFSINKNTNIYHFYDSNGFRFKTNIYDENLQISSFILYNFNSKCFKLECNEFTPDGKAKGIQKYRFDEEGKLLCNEYLTSGHISDFNISKVLFKRVFTYDDMNYVVEETRITGTTQTTHFFKHHEFDPYGNFINTTKINGNGIISICKRKIEYHKK